MTISPSTSTSCQQQQQESTLFDRQNTSNNSSFQYELKKPNPQKPEYEAVPPQTAAPWYSWILFSWMVPLFEKGEERSANNEPLKYSDLFPFPAHEDPVYNEQRLQVLWQEELKKNREDPDYKPNLSTVLFYTYRYRIFVGAFFRFLSDGATFAQPFLLREFTAWLIDPTSDTYIGWCWMIGIVLMNVLMTLSLNFAQQHTTTAFTQMGNAIRVLVFESSLRYPSNHEEGGKIISAATADLVQLNSLAPHIHGCYISPIIVLASVGSLFIFSGYAAFAVFGIMLFTIPIQACVMSSLLSFRTPFQQESSRRVNTLQELLQGVQLMKNMVWESNFAKRIFNARASELVWYNKMLQYRIPLMLMIIATPPITSFILFALQYVIEDEIKSEKVLPALTVLNGIRQPLFFIPLAWSKVFDVKIALQRVADVCSAHFNRHVYLKRLPIRDESSKPRDPKTGDEIVIEMNHVTVLGDPDFKNKNKKKGKNNNNKSSPKNPSPASTSSPSPAVTSPNKPNPTEEQEMKAVAEKQEQIIARDLSLNIHKGKLTLVIGACGSGKSVMISSLLGECDVKHDGGHVNIYGDSRIALVSQQAWIMNETVKQNIIMDQPFDQEKFNRAVDAAELTSDIEIFPGKEMTELGARGVTTSGGQKARIQLARAIYSDRDIIIADDVLAAVDPAISVAIFDKCFSNNGITKDKTRVLVTHQTNLVNKADRVILMKNCSIIFDGTVEELKASGLYDVVEEVEHEFDEKLKKEQEEQKEAKLAEDAKKKQKEEEEKNKQEGEEENQTEEEKKKKQQEEENTQRKKGALTKKRSKSSWYSDLGILQMVFRTRWC